MQQEESDDNVQDKTTDRLQARRRKPGKVTPEPVPLSELFLVDAKAMPDKKFRNV